MKGLLYILSIIISPLVLGVTTVFCLGALAQWAFHLPFFARFLLLIHP